MKSKRYLQLDFTTPEQSKRLLELGVSVDSANGYYLENSRCPSLLFYNFSYYASLNLYGYKCLPCWSVGRLIEILGICAGMECVDFETLARTEGMWSEKLIRIIEDLAKYNKLDFSKLEEYL